MSFDPRDTPEREALYDRVIETFQPKYEQRLTREDAREILHNLTGFFTTLARWHREDHEAAASGNVPAEPPPRPRIRRRS